MKRCVSSPTTQSARNNLGNVLCDQGKLDEAIAAYREAARLKPDLAGAHNGLGNVLCDQGKLDEAITEFRVLRLKPDYAEAQKQPRQRSV